MSTSPPSHPDDLPWETLARWVVGELSPAERAELERWLAEDPKRQAIAGELQSIWRESDQRQSWNAEAALEHIKEIPIGPARVIRLPARYRQEALPFWRRATSLGLRAAALLAAVGAGSLIYWQASRQGAAPTPPIASTEVSTARGQRASLRLPDGTAVVLGPSSILKYAVAHDRGPRVLELQGAAYFVVTHDSLRPFTVHTPRGSTTDLGTRFGVTAYVTDSAEEVVVAEGAVSLRPRLDAAPQGIATVAVALRAGDLGRLGTNGRVTAAHGVAAEARLGWTQGRLEFRDTPLRDVVVQFARWYNLDLRLEDTTIGARRLTASFQDESGAEVLRLIAASLNLRIKMEPGIAVLSPK